ncbi:MAG: trypsin-like peptidase domain-containing protein [bacterium]
MKKTLIVSVLLSVLITFLLTVPLTTAATYYFLKNLPNTKNVVDTATENKTVQVLNEQSATVDAVKKTEPAVVSVIITKDLPVMEQYWDSPFGSNDPFYNFQVPRYRQNGTQKQTIGGGTAFFITADGMLLTNKHVVSDSSAEYTVLMNDERKLPAKVLAQDPTNDVAILKVEGTGFPFIQIADSTTLQLGQGVIAIGNSLGEFRNTVSTGVISGLSRTITAGIQSSGMSEQLYEVIQTDAAINPGNSGGPLLNIDGSVIGMNTATSSEGQNIGFAIPIAEAMKAVDSYNKNGKIVKTYLGVRYKFVTKELQTANKLPYDYGVLVLRGETAADVAVIPGSPADKAGIVENDIILEIDGKQVTQDSPLAPMIQRHKPGDVVKLKVYDKGQEKDVDVTLEEQK